MSTKFMKNIVYNLLKKCYMLLQYKKGYSHKMCQLMCYFKLCSFSKCTKPLKILPPSSKQASKAQILQTAKKVTIEELAFLYPDFYKVFNLFIFC